MTATSSVHSRSATRVAWLKFKRSTFAKIGGAILAMLYLAALFADFLAPYPEAQSFRSFSYAPPTTIHWTENGKLTRPYIYGFKVQRNPETFERELIADPSQKYPLYFVVQGESYKFLGFIPMNLRLFGGPDFKAGSTEVAVYLWGADDFGRDNWGRMWYGARISLTIGIVATFISLVLGLVLGGISGYFAGQKFTIISGFEVLKTGLGTARNTTLFVLGRALHAALAIGLGYVSLSSIQKFMLTARGIEYAFGVLFLLVAVYVVYSFFWKGIVVDPDSVVMRLTEVISAIPTLFLLISLRLLFPVTLPPAFTFYMVVIMLSVIGWGGIARIVRSFVLKYREADYAQAAKALGASDSRIIAQHILPQTMTYLIISVTLAIPGYILIESGLSFIRLGITEPDSSWGLMLAQAQANGITAFTTRPWLLIPGVFIFVAILAWQFVGDGLRDAFDPRGKQS